jgi:vacuolar-type H+-ATPase subunit H
MSELATLVNEALKAELEASRIIEEAKMRADKLIEQAKVEAQKVIEGAIKRKELEVENHYKKYLEFMLKEIEKTNTMSLKLEKKLSYLKEKRQELIIQLSEIIVKYILGDTIDFEYS